MKGIRVSMNKNSVTERDIRLPQFKDANLEDLEFDGTGEVVRKDRFETAMRKISSMLYGVNGLSARSGWTCEQVVEALNIKLRIFERLEELILIAEFAPEDAEFYHFENKCYVKNIDQEHLDIAKNNPSESHLINFEFFEPGEEWEDSSAFLEYVDVLVSIDEIKRKIPLAFSDGEDGLEEALRGEHETK